jgi:peptide-methionine (S)-S-oxide reductase
MTEKKKATFAAGCFWGVESSFRQLDGVIDVTVGYTGGRIKNPTYEMVCSDRSGHAEAVEVEYDPSVVSYDTLLDVFWEIHDPTTMNRQGPDFGSQYRSAIFYHDESQRQAAEASIKRAAPLFEDPIVTEITPASEFYPAEEYHQRYYERMGLPNLCAIHAGGRK